VPRVAEQIVLTKQRPNQHRVEAAEHRFNTQLRSTLPGADPFLSTKRSLQVFVLIQSSNLNTIFQSRVNLKEINRGSMNIGQPSSIQFRLAPVWKETAQIKYAQLQLTQPRERLVLALRSLCFITQGFPRRRSPPQRFHHSLLLLF